MVQIDMYSNYIRRRAYRLRNSGKTYTEIQEILKIKIPKSTLSYWFKFVVNSNEYFKETKERNLVNLEKARIIAKQVLFNRRQIYLKEVSSRNNDIIPKIDLNIQKIILSVLYLCEGAKYKSSKFMSLANSNPQIILLFINLLNNCFNISKEKFRIRVQIRADQNVKELENYWYKITKIPRSQFYPTYIDTRTKGVKTVRVSYKGVCTIYYFNTDIQLELEFLAENVIKFINFGPVV